MSARTSHAQPSRRSGPRLNARVTRALWKIGVVAAVVAMWEWRARAAENVYFPPPTAILARMREAWFSGPFTHAFLTDEAIANFPPSLGRMFGGWGLACLAGIVLGVALGRSDTLAAFVDPLIQFGRAVPPPTLIPIFLVLLKADTRVQLATIMYGVIWPVLINTIDGARYIDRLHDDTAQVFGLTRAQRLFRIILPAAAPKIFAGLRLSLALSLILIVVSELAGGSTNGIGYELLVAKSMYDLAGMWGVIVLLGLLGYLFNASFLLVERRVLAWHRKQSDPHTSER
ncbi:ABC transporter permease [Streptosporangiaceae bacterium NEAU-GS5]|nr:ABC transporter permease [Streptosporangiaceae bacterium NEAU-GS5]